MKNTEFLRTDGQNTNQWNTIATCNDKQSEIKLDFYLPFFSGGTFALYSLICRHSNVNALPSQQTEVMDISAYKLELPNKHLRRAEKIRNALERSSFAKTGLLWLALLGTCMVIGDGILTPCISGYLNFYYKFCVLVLLFFIVMLDW